MAGIPPRRDGHSSGTTVAGRLSNQPERQGLRTRLRAPGRASLLFGFCSRRGLPAADVAADAVRSYRTLSPCPEPCGRAGGLLSVALSLGLPPPDVIRRRVRWSPDFPPLRKRRPSGRLADDGIWGRSDSGQGQSRAADDSLGADGRAWPWRRIRRRPGRTRPSAKRRRMRGRASSGGLEEISLKGRSLKLHRIVGVSRPNGRGWPFSRLSSRNDGSINGPLRAKTDGRLDPMKR